MNNSKLKLRQQVFQVIYYSIFLDHALAIITDSTVQKKVTTIFKKFNWLYLLREESRLFIYAII